MGSLAVEFMGIKFSNPVWAGSGTISPDLVEFQKLDLFGAVVFKTLTINPRYGNKPPRIFETRCGVVNSIGLQNPGFDRWVEENFDKISSLKTAKGISIGGESSLEYVKLAERIKTALSGYVDFVEVNVSCPNILTGRTLEDDPATLEDTLRGVRSAVDLPVVVKFGISNRLLLKESVSAEKIGIDAIALSNTIPAVVVDVENMSFFFDKVFAGLSGPAVKHISLASLYNLLKVVRLPVIGGGGVFTSDDAVEFLLLGASAVQVGVLNLVRPGEVESVIDGINKFLKRKKIGSVSHIIGLLKPHLESEN